MYNLSEYKKLIKNNLSPYRYHHCICVADAAKELAIRYGYNEEKAQAAGLLHDITKEMPPEAQRLLIKAAGMNMTPLEMQNIKIYHQMSGAAYVKLKLGIDDPDIVSAIRYHTTGRAGMTLPEQIIYLADFISADRDYDDLDVIRSKVDDGLLEGIIYTTKYSIDSLNKKHKPIHPDTTAAYEWAKTLQK